MQKLWASLVAQLVKNPPAIQEIWIWSPGWENPLEKGKVTHSSILAWRIPWLYSSWGLKESDMTEWFSLSLWHLRIFNVRESESRSVVSDSLRPHGLYSPWTSPSQNTGVGSLSLLQRIFPREGLNPRLPHCRQILYQLSHKGTQWMWELDYKESWAP